MARFHGIASLAEALASLAHPILRQSAPVRRRSGNHCARDVAA